MPSKLQFVPPTSKHPISIQFSESYRRKEKAYSNNYLKILEPDIHERQEMKHWALKSIVKPEHIRVKLLRVWKTKLKEGQFEDDDSNVITGPKAPKVGFHYV
jgi:hypothetical protein